MATKRVVVTIAGFRGRVDFDFRVRHHDTNRLRVVGQPTAEVFRDVARTARVTPDSSFLPQPNDIIIANNTGADRTATIIADIDDLDTGMLMTMSAVESDPIVTLEFEGRALRWGYQRFGAQSTMRTPFVLP